MASLEDLTHATFEPHVGEPFAIGAAGGPIELVLAAVRVLGDRPGGRDPFSLEFRGPHEPLLAQGIQRLEHAALGPLEIFVVPFGQDADGTNYEAIFS